MKRILSLMLVLVFAAGIAHAQEKEAVEKIIENYIKTHPEVLYNSLKDYDAKQRQAVQEAAFQKSMAQRYKVPVGSSPVKGPEDAPITIVEFSDFQCPYCARSVDVLKEVDAKYKGKVKFVFKHFPLENIHPLARGAAKASLAADKQGKFWEFHDTLLQRQQMWGQGDKDAMFELYAKELGLTLDQFKKDLSGGDHDKQIDDDLALGKQLNVQSTPTFFVNGVQMRGLGGPAYFARIIDTVLAEQAQEKEKAAEPAETK